MRHGFSVSDARRLEERDGEYLVGIYENRPYNQKRSGITLRQVYNSWYGQEGLPALPLIKLREDGPYL